MSKHTMCGSSTSLLVLVFLQIQAYVLAESDNLAQYKIERRTYTNGKRHKAADAMPLGVTPIINKGRDEIIQDSSVYGSGEVDFTEQVHDGDSGAEVTAEGDMTLTIEQWDYLQALANGSVDVSKRKSIAGDVYRWTDNVVPYHIQPDTYTDSDMEQIMLAIEEWNGFTCVKWQPRTTEGNYVDIVGGDGCSSSVGMTRRGRQTMILGQFCPKKDIVVHEMGHALGLFHEQSRHDRDDYVTVHTENILPSKRHNFDKYPAVNLLYFGEEYDYTSIMHYGEKFFSMNNEVTITSKAPEYQYLIGAGSGLSFTDVKVVNEMYNCGSHCSGSCPDGGFFDKDCVCQCKGDTSPFDICLHVPTKPCDGSSYQGPSPVACPACGNHGFYRKCAYYETQGGCATTSPYYMDAMRNCYKMCTGCEPEEGEPTEAPKTCGEDLIGSSGVITSPNFPNAYPNNANCEWTIQVPEGKAIKMETTPGTNFAIESKGACESDVLDIDFGDASSFLINYSHRFCGGNFNRLESTTNLATLTFISDDSVNLGGFSITYTAIDAPIPTPEPTEPPITCGGDLVASSGVFTSPNFPADHDNNIHCEWTVQVPAGKVIRFERTSATDFATDCQHDVLEISFANSNRQFCGERFNRFETTTNTATASFTSTDSDTMGGFSITFTAIDGPVPDSCSDGARTCAAMAARGFCAESSPFYSIMAANCKKTCNFC